MTACIRKQSDCKKGFQRRNPRICYMCSSRIFIPIQIKIIPPNISIRRRKNLPKCLPKPTARNDNMNVTPPMMSTGVIMEMFNIPKLTPIASASMLVAIESINSRCMPNVFTSSSISLARNASYIIFMPMMVNKPKAIQ